MLHFSSYHHSLICFLKVDVLILKYLSSIVSRKKRELANFLPGSLATLKLFHWESPITISTKTWFPRELQRHEARVDSVPSRDGIVCRVF